MLGICFISLVGTVVVSHLIFFNVGPLKEGIFLTTIYSLYFSHLTYLQIYGVPGPHGPHGPPGPPVSLNQAGIHTPEKRTVA